MWRLQEDSFPSKLLKRQYGKSVYWNVDYKGIRSAIIQEIGTDERTIKEAINKLKELKWIKRFTMHCFYFNKIARDWD